MSAPAVEAARNTPEPETQAAGQSPSAPMDGAFDTIASGTDSAVSPPADADAGAGEPAHPGLRARLANCAVALTRGLTRPIAVMIVGGIVAGAVTTSAIAWTILSKRNAELATRSALAQSQSERIAEQAAKIEALTREAGARPASLTQNAADPEQTATPAPPSATAEAAAAADASASVRVAPEAPPAPQRARMVPASGDQGGSGLCDVTQGKDAAKSMRNCLEWFNRADRGEAKPVK